MMMMSCVGGACGKNHSPPPSQFKFKTAPPTTVHANGVIPPLQLFQSTEGLPLRFSGNPPVPKSLLPVVYSSASQGAGAGIQLSPTGELRFFNGSMA
jgi:hypothetical protein